MIRKTVEGREFESQMIGELHFDKEPKEGSFNPVTSDAVAKIAGGVADLYAIVPDDASEENKLATAADVSGVQADVDAIEGKIPSNTSTTNKLVNESGLQDAIDNASESWSTGFTPKGESSVSDLNDLATQSNGDSYIVTDSGTLTDGSLAVVAGDQVAWDATNGVWYKLPQYALKQYGTDEIHNLSQEATSFASGDFIAVSNTTIGARKMSKDTMLELTAQNALGSIKDLATLKYTGYMALGDADGTGKFPINNLIGSIAEIYVPGTTSAVAGRLYMYQGKSYLCKENTSGAWVGSKFVEKPIQFISKCNEVQIYNGGVDIPYIEYNVDANNSIFLKCSSIVMRGTLEKSWTMAEIATEAGVSLTTSAQGVANCLEIPDGKCLSVNLDSKIMSVKSRAALTIADYVILSCINGILSNNIFYRKSELVSHFMNRTQVYVSGTSMPYIETPCSSGASIYIKVSGLVIRCASKPRDTLAMADIASDVGASLVTSPKGVAGCLEIPDTYTLVLDICTSKFILKPRANVLNTDFVLIANVNGNPVNTFLDGCKTILDVAKQKIQIYSGSGNESYLEQPCDFESPVYFKCNTIVLRGYSSKSWSMADVSSETGVSLVTSLKGVSDCLPINSTYSLVFNIFTKTLSIKSRDDVSPYDYVLFASVNGYVIDSQYREINYKSLANGFTRPSYDRDLNKTNADLKLGCGKCETFLFFSDPHVAGNNNSYSLGWQQDTIGLKKRVEELSVNSVNKIISGGDWLNELDTRLTALEKLSYINGMFDDEKFINVVGNHDLNYNGIYDTGYAKYTGELTKDEVQYTFMPKRNKLYYTEESSPNVEYFVLDSGNDQHPMTDYRWEQIDWLAGKLLTSQKSYGIICIHIYSSGGSDPSEWTELITPMATALMQLLLACNARTSVTLNGRTYDFTSASIRISFILSGHTHYDYVDSSQSIPVVTITKGFKNKVYNFDLGVADFTNKKLYMTRVGAGSDRIITIA